LPVFASFKIPFLKTFLFDGAPLFLLRPVDKKGGAGTQNAAPAPHKKGVFERLLAAGPDSFPPARFVLERLPTPVYQTPVGF